MKGISNAAIVSVTVVFLVAGCSDGADLVVLGNLALLGDCELPEGYTAVDLDDLLTASDDQACSFSGQKIMLRGNVGVTDIWVTEVICDEEVPCCNCARAHFGFGDWKSGDPTVNFVPTGDLDIGCAGSECRLYCRGMHEDKDYIVWGEMRCDRAEEGSDTGPITRNLWIDGFCKLSAEPTPNEHFTDPMGWCGQT